MTVRSSRSVTTGGPGTGPVSTTVRKIRSKFFKSRALLCQKLSAVCKKKHPPDAIGPNALTQFLDPRKIQNVIPSPRPACGASQGHDHQPPPGSSAALGSARPSGRWVTRPPLAPQKIASFWKKKEGGGRAHAYSHRQPHDCVCFPIQNFRRAHDDECSGGASFTLFRRRWQGRGGGLLFRRSMMLV